MKRPSLAVYLFGYKLDAIAYPWRASIDSALELAERVYFAPCDDETEAAARDMHEARLSIHPHAWGDHYTIQAHIANFLLDHIGTTYDYALKLDTDEVLCEWSFLGFYNELIYMKSADYKLGRPHYTHFCPDDKTTFPFIYSSKAVLSDTAAGLRFSAGPGGDACALGGSPEFQTHLEVFHYGKMHMGRRREALVKEHEFQKLYVELGFPDPKVEALWKNDGYMDYERVFDVSKSQGEFRAYRGQHPQFVSDWLSEMRAAEEIWQSSP